MSVEKNHSVICLIFAARAHGWNTTKSTVFLMKLGVSAEQNIFERAFSHGFFYVLFYTGKTTTFLTVSTIILVYKNIFLIKQCFNGKNLRSIFF